MLQRLHDTEICVTVPLHGSILLSEIGTIRTEEPENDDDRMFFNIFKTKPIENAVFDVPFISFRANDIKNIIADVYPLVMINLKDKKLNDPVEY